MAGARKISLAEHYVSEHGEVYLAGRAATREEPTRRQRRATNAETLPLSISSGPTTSSSAYRSSDIRVRVYGDAAVVTGRILRSRSVNGVDAEDDWRFTKTYVRQKGHWQVVAFYASPAPAAQ
ncbi:MAG TPA: nuclear transport factor 2 family protein [Vicinamibacterales bacterium]|nr:nuclear transport factor 2 family protein [Vicinamibacterales bacterium]